jgi:hypothetical protein
MSSASLQSKNFPHPKQIRHPLSKLSTLGRMKAPVGIMVATLGVMVALVAILAEVGTIGAAPNELWPEKLSKSCAQAVLIHKNASGTNDNDQYSIQWKNIEYRI